MIQLLGLIVFILGIIGCSIQGWDGHLDSTTLLIKLSLILTLVGIGVILAGYIIDYFRK